MLAATKVRRGGDGESFSDDEWAARKAESERSIFALA